MDRAQLIARQGWRGAAQRVAIAALVGAAFLGSTALAGAAPPPGQPGNGTVTATYPQATATPNNPTSLAVGSQATVTGTAGRGLNILAEPSGGAASVGQAPDGALVAITEGSRGDWYGVRYGEVAGWAYGRYLQPVGVTRPVMGVAPPATTTPVASTTPAASRGNAIVSAALRYLGAPYVWGGNTPSGWDCSGFVVYVYREVTGRTLPRTTQAQWAVGTPIARGALQAGDLVFFQNTSGAGITHVGIALGDGRFVHASSPRVGTVVSSLSESYYASRYAGARRP